MRISDWSSDVCSSDLLGGPLTGKFTNDGTISVLGDRALGVGLQDVTGDVRLAGTITAAGVDAIGARLAGDVTGALVVQGNLAATGRSEEHTSELQSLMRISYAVFCLKKKNQIREHTISK